MASVAPRPAEPRSERVSNIARLDPDTAWAAFMRRDRAWDGRVIGAVKSTGIYCKPSCPARRPKRENVEFYASGDDARAAGYRPCLRRKPDEVGRDRDAPAEYSRALRMRRAQSALKENDRVTDAIYDAGYSGPSGFYSDAKERLGMTPSAWRNGGRGETIRWTHFASPLGQMMIAATSKGICRLTFDDSEASLRRRFPRATIVEDAGSLRSLIEGA